MPASASRGIAVVTGASGGVGISTCGALLDAGYSVVGLDVTRTSNSLESNTDFLLRHCDIRNPNELEACIDSVLADEGPITLAVSIAGALGSGDFSICKAEEIEECVRLNLIAPIIFSRKCASLMKGRGCILLVSSISAIRGSPGFPAYSAAKAGLHGLTASLARRYGPKGIRVNAIVPGSIDGTAFGRSASKEDCARERAAETLKIQSRIPLRRVLTPNDIAGWVAFLASSDQASNGEYFRVDGGEIWSY